MNLDRFKSIRPSRPGLLGLSAALLTALSAAQAAGSGVEYISGGVGSEAAQRMQKEAAHWPATFEFAVKDGARADFAADVQVTVRDASGQVLLHAAKSEGPFMLVRLQPGRYDVEALLNGRSLTQSVNIKAGMPSKTLFRWPAAAAHPPG